MPRLTSQRPGALTSWDLGTGHWRLVVVAVPGARSPALALALRYPPNPPLVFSPTGAVIGLADHAQLVIATAPIEIAQAPGEVEPVARVALAGGSLEADIARTTEAMNLFKNNPRLRDETFQACLRDALAVIDGYWKIASWVQLPPGRERLEIACADARLILEP